MDKEKLLAAYSQTDVKNKRFNQNLAYNEGATKDDKSRNVTI